MSIHPMMPPRPDRRRAGYRCDRFPATSEPATDFGARLRQLRTERRLSQNTIAQRTQFAPSYINRLEGGSRMPTRDAVDRLADALGCPESERRDLLQAAGFHVETPPLDPLLADLAALLTDPAMTDDLRQAVRDALDALAVMMGRAPDGEAG